MKKQIDTKTKFKILQHDRQDAKSFFLQKFDSRLKTAPVFWGSNENFMDHRSTGIIFRPCCQFSPCCAK